MKDPSNLTISCSTRGIHLGHTLCDLRTSIKLMSLSVFKKLDIGMERPIIVSLQLADSSITHFEGKIEDILVQMDIFSADFIILNYEEDKEVPIILRRPFLSIVRTLLDVQQGELTMRVANQEIKLNMLDALKYSQGIETCQSINALEWKYIEQKMLNELLS